MELAEYAEDDWLSLSGIQHFSFCRRQWALIHVEQLWQDNVLTTSGSIEHERAHDYGASEKRGDLLILRDLRVFSRRMGVSGACDVVEFHASPDGVTLQGRDGQWIPYPVEYKHGQPKTQDADRLQLCAEAMCLEEMLSCDIREGALFYQHIRRRETVSFDESLRETVTDMFRQMHDFYTRGHTPKVRTKQGCKACSLKDVCLPELLKKRSARKYVDDRIYEVIHDSEVAV
ncbi:CRISPR-associated protein Cas4 [Bifidobacterium hapali]|uniref:CRISPR-associated exonuclease Cas4 n=1 Tax=Bifidobacterium hapali TaxID=1630172 RepID=A0A261FUC4_9BIFI|nr:CRISPR-associated protein Cas4 [Bifidobacterium hapali]OZG62787.1 CRISPR-associated protein Cas4 [Bifidobacterium hapali]